MKSLETVVREFNVKHDCLVLLAKKLVAIGSLKALISASRLCCRLAPFIPSKYNNDVVKILTDNASHKAISVRAETAVALREVLLEGGFYEFAALTALKKLIRDNQTTVQVVAFETLCWRVHSKQYFQTSLFPLVLGCLEVKNWRTRYVLVRQMATVLASLEAKNRKPIVVYFTKCLNDPELEVSILALQTLKSVLGLLEVEDIIDKILPELGKLVTAENADVKMAVATSLPSLAPALTRVPEALNQVKSLVATMTKDTNPEVRAKLLLNIEPYLKTLVNQGTNTSFLGIVFELLADKNWKVRVSGLKALEILVVKFPEDFGQDDKVLKTFNDKLTDRIANVRRTAMMSLKGIAFAQGVNWTEKNLVPILHAYVENPNYLYRFNFLFGIGEVFQLLPPQSQAREAELAVKMTKDPVPNIRFEALLILLRFSQILEDKSMEERTRRAADAALSDSDGEVRRLAKAIASNKDLKNVIEKGPEFNG